MIDIFSNTETYICPTCLQPVSEKYKQDLVQSVQKVLSKTVEEHLAELCTVMAEEIEIDQLITIRVDRVKSGQA